MKLIGIVTIGLVVAWSAGRGHGQPNPASKTGSDSGTGPNSGPASDGLSSEVSDPSATPAAPNDRAEADKPTLAQELGVTAEVFTAKLYGYVDGHFEKSAATPARIDAMGRTVTETSASEWDVKNLNIMLQGKVYGRYRYFINLSAAGSGSSIEDVSMDVRNAWVELPLYRDLFNFRIGKTYRRFGLYNEILDAVPTFIGIEPPEMFDDDHLMLTRTTNAMLHGNLISGDSTISYALSTGQDERRRAATPFGADLRFELGSGLLLGGSYYTTNGDAAPSHEVDQGAPIGGVANWTAKDDFNVYTVFGQLSRAGFLLQGEFTTAQHDAERDPERVLALVDAGLFRPQLMRFGLADSQTPADVIVPVKYTVHAAYTRVGYEIKTSRLSFVPYAQFDYYSNPENIDSEDFGGDHEAGLADDGKFYKTTLGLVIRPVRFVAVKVDGSTHTHRFNGELVTYPEFRMSFSLYWEFGNVE
jgi:hypothetical protein